MVGRIRCSRTRSSSRSASPERLVGRDRPHEPGEFAGAGDHDLLVWLATTGHPPPARVQALLAAPGPFDRGGVLAALAARELVADLRPAARVPGGLDQKPAHVGVADLGDRALLAALAGGVLGRHQPDKAHERLGRLEAPEIIDLDHGPERGERVNAAKTP